MNLLNERALKALIEETIKEQRPRLEEDLFEKKEGWKNMISIWEGLAWAIIGLLTGIVLGDPDKKKYFN